MSQSVPPIETVVETAVYASDLDAMEAFYGGILGMPMVKRVPNHHVFFRVGPASMFLVFNSVATMETGGELPPHGATGPGHSPSGSRPTRSTPGDDTSRSPASPSRRSTPGREAAVRCTSATPPEIWPS